MLYASVLKQIIFLEMADEASIYRCCIKVVRRSVRWPASRYGWQSPCRSQGFLRGICGNQPQQNHFLWEKPMNICGPGSTWELRLQVSFPMPILLNSNNDLLNEMPVYQVYFWYYRLMLKQKLEIILFIFL